MISWYLLSNSSSNYLAMQAVSNRAEKAILAHLRANKFDDISDQISSFSKWYRSRGNIPVCVEMLTLSIAAFINMWGSIENKKELILISHLSLRERFDKTLLIFIHIYRNVMTEYNRKTLMFKQAIKVSDENVLTGKYSLNFNAFVSDIEKDILFQANLVKTITALRYGY